MSHRGEKMGGGAMGRRFNRGRGGISYRIGSSVGT
jgi:hypothetical protein